MVARVLIIGGYGHFGSYIARSLAAMPKSGCWSADVPSQAFIAPIRPIHAAEGHAIDINGDLPEALRRLS